MNEPQYINSPSTRNAVLQLNTETLSAEMVQMRCNVVLQQNIWHQQQQQLQQHNNLLLLSLFQLVSLNISTEHKLQQLAVDSQCDALTQTLNRNIMLDRITHAISVAKRQKSQFALLFIDLDNFKPINDQHGHAAGDIVLQQVSKRLTAAIRDSDAISRHGGDEFLLLLNDIKNAQDATHFASKLEQALAEPYQLAGCDVLLSASIGVSLFPDHGDCPSALIGDADAAMYRAKQQGGARVCSL